MSKFMLFDFRCNECLHVFDDMVKPDVKETLCSRCPGTATRMISAPRLDPKMGLDPDFPKSYGQWEKRKKNHRAVEKKHFENHGTDYSSGGDVKR